METGRELFVNFMHGNPLSRPAFVPLIRGLAAKVGNTSMEPMQKDATLWANSLVKTVDLFGLDGVVANFSFTLLAEALGCRIAWENDRPTINPLTCEINPNPLEQGRLKQALEAAKRVFELCRGKRACITCLTGPATLASQLFGPEKGPDRLPEIKESLVKATEGFSELRPDVIIFMERRPLGTTKLNLKQRKIYNTLTNIVSYYDILSGLYLQGYDPDNLIQYSKLGMDIYVLGPSLEKTMPPLETLWEMSEDATGVGVSLPSDDLLQANEIINQTLSMYQSHGPRGLFFTSFGSLTRKVSLEALHELVNEIKQVSL